MDLDWVHELSDQLDWYWTHLFRPRLAGLTDDEYFWEPVPGCWNVRPAAGGRFTLDFERPEPSPAPITTIGWRLCHILLVLRHPADPRQFGGPSPDVTTFDWPHSAAACLALLDEACANRLAGLRSLTAEALAQPLGPVAGAFAESSYAALILHINREVFHHAAEVALLRDLYRAGFKA